MRLTDEQFAAMQPYENHFRTAVKASWSRNPGMSALDLIHDTYVKVTGNKVPLNKGCSHCVLRLLTDMGMIFLADDFERKIKNGVEIPPAQIAEWSKIGIPLDVMTKTVIKGDTVVEKKVVVKESLAAEPVKAEVKTRKPRKPKK